MTNDEMRGEMTTTLANFKDEMRGEMTSFKGEIREEMTTAIQASEVRMTQRIDQVQKSVLE